MEYHMAIQSDIVSLLLLMLMDFHNILNDRKIIRDYLVYTISIHELLATLVP